MFFKNDPALLNVPLAPQTTLHPGANPTQQGAVALYNRVGGLMSALASAAGVRTSAIVATWMVESSGAAFVPGQAIIRLEVHKFFDNWGRANSAIFDQHFQFGGHAGVAGKPWENQRFRERASDPFAVFHGNQQLEYQVLSFARTLDDDAALRSTSIGGDQIMMSNHRTLGYDTAAEMFDSFQQDERFQILGFADFCGPALLRHLADEDWLSFATGYNGQANAAVYSSRLKTVHDSIAHMIP